MSRTLVINTTTHRFESNFARRETTTKLFSPSMNATMSGQHLAYRAFIRTSPMRALKLLQPMPQPMTVTLLFLLKLLIAPAALPFSAFHLYRRRAQTFLCLRFRHLHLVRRRPFVSCLLADFPLNPSPASPPSLVFPHHKGKGNLLSFHPLLPFSRRHLFSYFALIVRINVNELVCAKNFVANSKRRSAGAPAQDSAASRCPFPSSPSLSSSEECSLFTSLLFFPLIKRSPRTRRWIVFTSQAMSPLHNVHLLCSQ